MVSMFDLRDPSNRDRLAMARTGSAMVRDYPLTGVGPAMIPKLYTQYRDPDAVQAINPHLHNAPLQIAAERGLPALAIWLAFIAVLSYHLFRIFRTERDQTLAAAGLAAIAGMFVGRSNHFFVLDRSAGLHHGGCTRGGDRVEPVTERDERI